MIENYLSTIINMENFVDGMLIVDEKAVVVHVKQYRDYTPFTEEEALGKNLRDLYPDVELENSPILRALYLGETTINKEGTMRSYKGEIVPLRTTTFPIKENGKIIGAVNIANYPGREREEINVRPLGGRIYKKLYRIEDIVGRSANMVELRRRIGRVGKTDSAVMIIGETGTGKELVAQSIHTESHRRHKMFISQNCAAIPANLLESIFFGTTKGSYTGAENRPGIFEAANGGTVFLDEINSMDIAMQAKLLRVLEEKKVRRIGSTEEIQVDVRIVAATNEPPLECIRQGKMRQDLFYRLGSVTLDIPSLRERMEDLELLLMYYISRYNQEFQKNIQGLSPEAEGIIREYPWPGNVRELRNALESAYNFCDGVTIQKEDLPGYILQAVEDPELLEALLPMAARRKAVSYDSLKHGSLKEAVDQYEKQLIEHALKDAPNLSRLADRLGITRQTLNQKLLKYGLQGSQKNV